jgi:hypothetical protein
MRRSRFGLELHGPGRDTGVDQFDLTPRRSRLSDRNYVVGEEDDLTALLAPARTGSDDLRRLVRRSFMAVAKSSGVSL